MSEVRLYKHAWHYDSAKPLGPAGGFGAVFHGEDVNGNPAAVKRLHIGAADAAHRELALAQDLAGRQFDHVMPILDAGQDANSDEYFVVMPVAERSLQDYLSTNGPLAEGEAAEILDQIVRGLEEAHHSVHRDLKPGNVLWHDGRWKIADFGIARFVEDSTSLQTLKGCLSPQFAAPEQWKLEHATAQTDIYALGCIAHVLLSGMPPFNGTGVQIRDGHLHGTPPKIPNIGAQMRTLTAMMLRKSPGARPSRPRIRAILEQVKKTRSTNGGEGPLHRLASAAAAHEHAESVAEADQARKRTEAAQREALVNDARSILRETASELRKRVSDAVPNASIIENGSQGLLIRVGSATLELELDVQTYGEDAFSRSKWDVICGSAIGVDQSTPPHKRSASLWYTRKIFPGGEYRWYEVGYEGNPLSRQGFQFEPTAVGAELADRAHWNAMDVVQQSYYPKPIDGEDTDAFCDRWVHILATACEGRLRDLPKNLPQPGT